MGGIEEQHNLLGVREGFLGRGRRASVEAGDRNRKWEPSRKNGDSVCAPRTKGHRKGPSSNRILKLTSPRETPRNMKGITDLY